MREREKNNNMAHCLNKICVNLRIHICVRVHMYESFGERKKRSSFQVCANVK